MVVLLIMSYTGTTAARVQASVISCGLRESQEDLLIIKNKCHSTKDKEMLLSIGSDF